MVKKFNLSEAAAEILHASVTSKKSGQDKPGKLSGAVAYGTKEADLGGTPNKTHGQVNPDGSKGAPTATPPGATPPVGAEPMKKLSGQPAGDGSQDNAVEADPTSYEAIRDRIAGKKPAQTMQANAGATFQSYAEEEDREDESVISEAEKEEGHEDAAEDKAQIKKMMNKQKMKEDLDALLSGENLSEEFVQKASTIFEAAVVTRVAELAEEVEQQMEQQFELVVEELKNDFSSKVDDYLNYMVEEWMKQNELAIESGLRSEIVEDFLVGMRNLFAEHYIDIPEEKVSVVEDLAAKVEELESKLNEEIERNVEFAKELNEHKKIEAIHAVCEGLTQTQVEKIVALAENVDFTTEQEFAEKLITLKEAYVPSNVKPAEKSALEEGIDIEETKAEALSDDPLVNMVAKSISKSVVK